MDLPEHELHSLRSPVGKNQRRKCPAAWYHTPRLVTQGNRFQPSPTLCDAKSVFGFFGTHHALLKSNRHHVLVFHVRSDACQM